MFDHVQIVAKGLNDDLILCQSMVKSFDKKLKMAQDSKFQKKN
jgi:hypothetical protein